MPSVRAFSNLDPLVKIVCVAFYRVVDLLDGRELGERFLDGREESGTTARRGVAKRLESSPGEI